MSGPSNLFYPATRPELHSVTEKEAQRLNRDVIVARKPEFNIL
jgi:hypothetical protein